MSATLKQIDANRANAAHSTGPRTPQGKAASAQNATSHGLFAAVLVVHHWESQTAFDDLRNDYLIRFQPIDRVERDLVDRLIDSTWRRNRILSIETTLLDLEIAVMDPKVEDDFRESGSGLLRVALAFRERHGERTWDSIQRYLAQTERSYHRALRDLETLQGGRFNQMPAAATPQLPVEEPEASQGPDAATSRCAASKIHVITEQTQIPAEQPSEPTPSTAPTVSNAEDDARP